MPDLDSMGWGPFTLGQIVLTSVTLGALKKNGAITYAATASDQHFNALFDKRVAFMQSEHESYQERHCKNCVRDRRKSSPVR